MLHRSNDHGDTWRLILDVQEKFGGAWGRYLNDDEMSDLCFDPSDPGTMHFSKYQLGVLTSRDGGETWAHTLKTTNGLSL